MLGLPGNPASAFVCAELFLRPLVLALQGATTPHRMDSAALATPLPANGPREHWMRARLGNNRKLDSVVLKAGQSVRGRVFSAQVQVDTYLSSAAPPVRDKTLLEGSGRFEWVPGG